MANDLAVRGPWGDQSEIARKLGGDSLADGMLTRLCRCKGSARNGLMDTAELPERASGGESASLLLLGERKHGLHEASTGSINNTKKTRRHVCGTAV